MSKLTHFDETGKAVMVDIGEKVETRRRAVASARVLLNAETIAAIKNNQTPKGNPLEIARIAGIMAAKRTADLIPLCHQIDLSKVEIRAELTDYGVSLESEAATTGQTGVEMEALTAVSVAALTVYDMCKALDKTITITDVRLEAKTGGKSGDFERRKMED
ncbi:MAG: cyclic pyranopterin monophosphate synthase MoaC [Acidobacteriota bacterium]|nr:cyclic pyranopterin monophosphate synthase MoaC [Acidobacteriota bacterium]